MNYYVIRGVVAEFKNGCRSMSAGPPVVSLGEELRLPVPGNLCIWETST